MISDKIYSLDLSYLQSLPLAELDQNLKKYPFSSNMRILRLLAMKVQNNENFTETLYHDAALVPDRTLLKKRLDYLTNRMSEIHFEQIAVPAVTEVPSAKETSEIESESYDIQLINQDQLNDNYKEADATDVKEPQTEPDIALTNDASDEAILIPEDILQSPEITEEPDENHEIKQENSSPIKTDDMSEDTTDTRNEFNDDSLSAFAKWLKNKTVQKTQATEMKSSAEVQKITEPVKIEAEQSVVKTDEPTNEWEGIQEKILSEYKSDLTEKKSKRKSKAKQSDKSKKKKENNDSDETTFITETYALLLEKQQKYSQALKIYDKLSLLFPEKRLYFAQKIELLKNL